MNSTPVLPHIPCSQQQLRNPVSSSYGSGSSAPHPPRKPLRRLSGRSRTMTTPSGRGDAATAAPGGMDRDTPSESSSSSISSCDAAGYKKAVEEQPVAAGSVEFECEDIRSAQECPFPGHDAFRQDKAQRRLRNKVQLSAYGDAIGGNLAGLQKFIDDHLKGVVKGLHLLPIYPSSGDGGFAPLTYKEVDPRMGTWGDVTKFADNMDLELELMVNHISPESAEFQDFLANGDASPYADMFVDWDAFWPNGDPSEQELKIIRTRKPEAPVLEVTMKDGSTRRLWCTFGPQQIDINPFSKPGRRFIESSLGALCHTGAKIVRLDAFGYCTKKPGTRCFMEEPEVWQLLERLNRVANKHGTRLLCEVHEEWNTNLQLAAHGYWVYDFALPLLVLHAFTFRTALSLRNWLRICPRRQFTVLDTHDGMGIDDISGLASVCDVKQLQHVLEDNLHTLPNFKYKRENGAYTGHPHQYNATYFSAVGESPRAYLLARAIQFWTPGIPMVYYNGLLCASNDMEGVEREGPRGVNRHRYTLEEAAQELERPVVKALMDMCRFRNRHPAFDGQIAIKEDDNKGDHWLEVTWHNDQHFATLRADLSSLSFEVFCSRLEPSGGDETIRFELDSGTTSWSRSEIRMPVKSLEGLRTDELASIPDEAAKELECSMDS